jgi:cytochrome c-type biogenesis protein CcmH/NrfG
MNTCTTFAFRASTLAWAVALTSLTACDTKSEGDLLSAAQGQLDKRDPNGAVIHLEKVLEKNGESSKGRLLLGRALLMKGDASGALVELERAQERGATEDETAPDVARALVWAAAGSADTDLSFLSRLELYRADVPDGRVSTSRVVEAFDVVEHI